MNRTPLLIILAASLLVALGIIIGQGIHRAPTPPPRATEAPQSTPAVPTERVTVLHQAPVTPPPISQIAPPNYGTDAQAIAAYKTVAGTATDSIRQGLSDLRRVSQNVPQDIDTSAFARESWANQAATAAAFISGGGRVALGITNVPASCYESHRILVDVARRSNTFAQTYIANVRTIKEGSTSPEVERQAQELEASLANFDASLTRL